MASRRVPSDLYGPVLWCAFLAVLFLRAATLSASPSVRWILVGLLFGAVAVSLVRLRPWARVAAAVLFVLSLLNTVRISFSAGFTMLNLSFILMNGWWTVYMLRPSTRRIFTASGETTFDLPGFILRLSSLFLVAGLGLTLAWNRIPIGWTVAAMIAAYVFYGAFVEKRLESALRRGLAARPPELDAEQWLGFQRAQSLRASGDIEAAFKVLDPLPPVSCVRALRGLLFLARPDVGGPLRRFVFDTDYFPDDPARARMAQEARDPAVDVDACVQERAEVVDALLADAFSKRPLFVSEADAAIQRITGRSFVGNEEYAHREAWAVARPLCSGPRGRTWLTLRLWERMAHEAAEAVAERSPDPALREAAGLSRRFAEGARDGALTPEWVEENARALSVMPMFADAFRLLYLDLPYLQRFGSTAASRLLLRLELVAALRRVRDDYPAEAGGWTAMLLAILAGQSKGLMTKKKRFDPWWSARRESQATFDARFTTGLEAAAKEDWEAGAEAFGEAARAWPERACARHNGAVCLLRAGHPERAEKAFEALTAEEPDEPLYWLRLGDARRAGGKSREALAAYRRAAKIGGLEQAASVRLGLALADEGRDDEAKRALDAAAGPEPDAETLDGLADFLEQEGVFGLAHHYRQKALNERLAPEDPVDGDEDEASAV